MKTDNKTKNITPAYSSYKDSGIEWIGEIPSRWDVKKLKYISFINPSKACSNYSQESQELATFLPMEAVEANGSFSIAIQKPISELWNGFTYFEINDVILAKITPCFENGKGAHLDNLGSQVGFGSTEFHVLRYVSNKSDARFLYYITKSYRFCNMGQALMTGAAGQKRVPSSFLEEYIQEVPPLPEQQTIADFLDDKTAKIDNLICIKRKQIELLKEQRTAVINHAVTKGLDPNAPMKDSGIEWLGEIPEHWEVANLKRITQFLYGNSLSNENRLDGNVPVYGSNGITGYHNQSITDAPCIIIGRKGSFGKINYSDICCFPIDTTYFVDKSATIHNVRWLFYSLQTLELDGFSKDSAVPGLSREDAYSKVMLLPPINEQQSIVDFLEGETERIDVAISKAEKQIELLTEYRTALISEAVTGKIKVRETA